MISLTLRCPGGNPPGTILRGVAKLDVAKRGVAKRGVARLDVTKRGVAKLDVARLDVTSRNMDRSGRATQRIGFRINGGSEPTEMSRMQRQCALRDSVTVAQQPLELFD